MQLVRGQGGRHVSASKRQVYVSIDLGFCLLPQYNSYRYKHYKRVTIQYTITAGCRYAIQF